MCNTSVPVVIYLSVKILPYLDHFKLYAGRNLLSPELQKTFSRDSAECFQVFQKINAGHIQVFHRRSAEHETFPTKSSERPQVFHRRPAEHETFPTGSSERSQVFQRNALELLSVFEKESSQVPQNLFSTPLSHPAKDLKCNTKKKNKKDQLLREKKNIHRVIPA